MRTKFSSSLAVVVALVCSTDAGAQDWKVVHWNVLHGWGRYWDNSSTTTDPAVLWPPTGPFSAISDDGGGPNAQTYKIATGEPSGGCGTAPYTATWQSAAQPMQQLLQSGNVAGDPDVVAMTLSEAADCISASGVRNAIAAVNGSWTSAAVFASGRDGLIARYGFVTPSNATVWNLSTNTAGDIAAINCTGETKYNALHAYIYTDATHTAANAVHLFATRVRGDNTCEEDQLDAFVQAKAGPNGRVLMMGDFNTYKGTSEYAELANKGYIDAGTDLSGDAWVNTCCFGNTWDGRTDDPRILNKRYDIGWARNLGASKSYWVGNQTVGSTDEVAMSDHAVIKVGFTNGATVDNPPVLDADLTQSPNPSPAGQAVTLTVQAHDPDGDALSYSWVFGDGATGTGGSGSIQHTYATAGTYTASVTITDGRGGSVASSAQVTICSSCGSALPAPWNETDIGPGVNGWTDYATGTFKVTAGGTDLWSTSDAFHFVYQAWNGDVEVIANVEGFSGATGAAFSLAAVEVRAALTQTSPHASMMITDTAKGKFRYRTTDGGTTTSTGYSEGTLPAPRYLKLKRVGDVFHAYVSQDGAAWTEVAGSPATIALPQSVYVGLAVLRNGSTAPQTTATIDHVSVTLPDGWRSTDIGAVGVAGSEVKNDSAFQVTAGGIDIWSTSDAFRYVYRTMTGDGTVTAYIDGLTAPPNASFALGGVMIRGGLTATSVHATMMTTTQQKAKFRRRLTDGGDTLSDGPATGTAPYPIWVRVVRSGDLFTAYYSSDGTTWLQAGPTETIAMPSTVYVGLVTLRNGSTATAVTVQYHNVSVP